MVVPPLVAGSGGGLVCRPLHRRRQHAEGLGEIEMGEGCGRLRLARNARWTHPQLVGWRRGHCWPAFRSAGRVGLRYERRQLPVELL